MLHAVPLQSLLDWLSQPKGPNLVEASTATAPDKALVLAATKCMLYGEDTLYVGVGLMYKPHYISKEPFSTAYMHLHVWHAVGSSADLANKLNFSHLILVTVSEMSDVIPVVAQHPVFLDMATKETIRRTGEPMAPSPSEVSGSILYGTGHLEGTRFVRSLFPISEGRPLHPCWSTSKRSFPRVYCRDLRC